MTINVSRACEGTRLGHYIRVTIGAFSGRLAHRRPRPETVPTSARKKLIIARNLILEVRKGTSVSGFTEYLWVKSVNTSHNPLGP